MQQDEEEKLSDREEYRNKQAKTRNRSGQQKGGLSLPQFHKSKRPKPSSSSAPAPKNEVSIVARIRINLRRDQLSLKVVWH